MRFLLTCCLSWLLASAALAQEEQLSAADDEAARSHFEAGRLHFDRGAYEEADREFSAAYELSGRTSLLYNLLLTAERLGNLDVAIERLELFLQEGEHAPEQRTNLEARLEHLRQRRAAQEAETETETVETNEGAEPAERDEGLPIPAIATFGVAGAALISGVIFGALAISEHSSLEGESCAIDNSCSDDQVSNLRTYTLVADISFGISLAAAVAATVLLFTMGGDDDEGDDAPMVGAWLTPNAGGASVMWRMQ